MTPKQTWNAADWGGGMYAVRGHVTADAWAEAVRVFEGDEQAPAVKFIRYDWNRYVPDNDGGSYHEAAAHARGAFSVTVGEVKR